MFAFRRWSFDEHAPGARRGYRRVRFDGRRPVVDDDKRSAILARRQRGKSIRTIAARLKVSVGVVHKTLAEAQPEAQQEQ